jgi:uncharacterized protein DUF3293
VVQGPSLSDPLGDWGDFPDTVLHFRSLPALTLDLREKITTTDRETLGRIGFERSFGIISAEDPMGVTQPAAVNAALAARLLQDVAQLDAMCADVDACSPDRSHCEQSVAIAIGLQSLTGLAYRYRQLAIFWFDGEAFSIVPVHSNKAMLRLPVRG